MLAASDISQLDDMDELEVYGDQPHQHINSQICQFTFEVSILSLLQQGICMKQRNFEGIQ